MHFFAVWINLYNSAIKSEILSANPMSSKSFKKKHFLLYVSILSHFDFDTLKLMQNQREFINLMREIDWMKFSCIEMICRTSQTQST